MELIFWSLVVVASLLALVVIWSLGRLRSPPTPIPSMVVDTPKTCAGCEEIERQVEHLRAELQTVMIAVADGITHVDRVENRIRGAVKRARKELQERGLSAPGLEAEAAGLSLVDDEGGGGEAMPVMPASVAADQSSVPGVTPEQLRRVRGI